MSLRLTTRPYQLPLREPWRTHRGAWRTRTGILLRVQQDELVGWGDACLPPGASSTQQAQVRRELEGLKRRPRARIRSAPARFALDQARLDIEAQRRGWPMWRLLGEMNGGAKRPAQTIRVNAVIPLTSVASTLHAARRRIGQGYTCLKIKSSTPDRTLTFVRALRDQTASGLTLRIDVNGAWSTRVASRWLPRFETLDIEFVEQPVPPGRPEAWRTLRKATSLRLAADEDVSGPRPGRFVGASTCDVIVVKPPAMGRFQDVLDVARRAGAAGQGVVVTDSVDSAVGRQGALHVAAVAGDRDLAHGLGSGEWFRRDVVARPARVHRGRLDLPREAGLGLEVTW